MITGANAGIGLEAVGQSAMLESTKKVYMACRSESKKAPVAAGVAAAMMLDPLGRNKDGVSIMDKLDFIHFNILTAKRRS
jgi:NAD(P)-dependent dehydrogenase (short-subunit alcohol dehydrogenase family)